MVELLVIIAVIAILVGLGLPALQQTRETARRTSCSNNLRQLGIGLHNHHETLGSFPVGCVEWRSTDPASRQLAWSAYLLPFMEQVTLSDSLDLDRPFDDSVNAVAASATISTFRCPSGLRVNMPRDPFGISDYGGIFGERINSPNSPAKGVMLIDVAVSASDILDGLSNTLIVAEDTRSDDGFWINGRNIFDQAFAVNSGPDFENDMRSEHPGGANACRCDASVGFFSETMNLRVLGAVCTRAGGELLD